jgi:hypothetical protein
VLFAARRKPTPSTTRATLSKKRAAVLKHVQAAVSSDDITKPLDTHALGQLRTTLAALRRDIAHQPGSKSRAAAAALADLDTALAKLSAVQSHAPGPHAQSMIEDGLRALHSAHAHARKAGSDWPL